MKTIILTLLVMATPLAGSLQAQQTDADRASRYDLPAAVADLVVERLNDPSVDVRQGDLTVDPADTVAAGIVVLDGSLTLDGRIPGDVLVVNGDAHLRAGAEVTGDVLVVGGRAITESGATVGGEIASYSAPFAYERSGGRVRVRRGPSIAGNPIDRSGFSDFLITTGKSYNRVEGMPIAFGPRLGTEGSNPLRLQALAIYRSEAGLTLDTERMGYFVQADQFIGGYRDYRVGGSLYSVVDPIEEWQITDLESGLATFLFHRDYRDHYQRHGGGVHFAWEPRGSPLRAEVEGRWERHRTRASGSPWSLFRNADFWRPQRVIADGDITSIVVQADYDSRSSDWNPASGWFVHGQIEQALNADLAQPAMVAGDSLFAGVPIESRTYGRFLTGLVDLRRYNRINASSRLNVRVVAGGSLTAAPLPPQRQHSLGGEGSLPGYMLFDSDCAARSRQVGLADQPSGEGNRYFPNYGCDAFTLIQAEFRGKLAFRFRWDVGPWRDDPGDGDSVWDFGWDMAPDWALFVDGGRGWTFDPTRPDDSTRIDVGAGLLLERIGLYVAMPVEGGTGLNVFLRLGPRF